MPFLAVIHLRAAQCPECGTPLAAAGARSFVVDGQGAPGPLIPADPPAELTLEIACPNGHSLTLLVPNEVAAEEASPIPGQRTDRAPTPCCASDEPRPERCFDGTLSFGAPRFVWRCGCDGNNVFRIRLAVEVSLSLRFQSLRALASPEWAARPAARSPSRRSPRRRRFRN